MRTHLRVRTQQAGSRLELLGALMRSRQRYPLPCVAWFTVCHQAARMGPLGGSGAASTSGAAARTVLRCSEYSKVIGGGWCKLLRKTLSRSNAMDAAASAAATAKGVKEVVQLLQCCDCGWRRLGCVV